MFKISKLMLFFVLLLAPWLAQAQFSGGSNYGWYYVDLACNSNPYGVVPNNDTSGNSACPNMICTSSQTLISQQLVQMHNNGQTAVKIPIYLKHYGGAPMYGDGTVMDTTGSTTSAPLMVTSHGTNGFANLHNLLLSIQQIGFQWVYIAIYTGPGDMPNGQWSPSIFAEKTSVIANVRNLVRQTGMLALFDLNPEGIPSPYESDYSLMSEYAQQLWAWWGTTFPSEAANATMSVIADPYRYAQLSNVFKNNPDGFPYWPDFFDIHLYDSNAYNLYVEAYQSFVSQNWVPPILIGEATYDDPSEAQTLTSAVRATGMYITDVFQWPLAPAPAPCSSSSANEPAPNTVSFLDFRHWETGQ